MVTSYAVIGASRGIGLEFVLQLAARPDSLVFAVVRNGETSTHLNTAIKDLTNVHVVDGDVTDYPSLERAAQKISNISGGKLDCLIHNAARMSADTLYKDFDSFESMDQLDADFIDAYKTNALGVIHSIRAFLPLLRAGHAKKIAVTASEGGNPAFVRTAGLAYMAAYGMTKGAAHVATNKWAVKLAPEGFVVASLSPGLVDTTGTIGDAGDAAARKEVEHMADEFRRRGFPTKILTPARSVELLIKAIDKLSQKQNGRFLAPTLEASLGVVRGKILSVIGPYLMAA